MKTRLVISKRQFFLLFIGTILSSLTYSLAVKCFVQPYGLLSNGLGGIAIILSRIKFLTNILTRDQIFSLTFVVLNIPILIAAYKQIGKYYTLFTILNIGLTSLLNILIPDSLFSFLNLSAQSDLILIAISAGILTGISSGIALREGLSTGGVDTLGTFIGLKFNKEVGAFIFIINVIILVTGGFVFHDWASVLYTVIYIFVAGQVINAIYRRTRKRLISIVTDIENKDKICEEILSFSKHGISTYECIGEYSKTKKFELRTVVLESEATAIINAAKAIDPNVFVTILNVHNVHGNYTMPKID